MRTLVLGTVASLAIAGTVAVADLETAAAPSPPVVTVVAPDRSPSAPGSQPSPDLPPVSMVRVETSVSAPPAPLESDGLNQTVHLAIVGGDLRATPTSVEIPLRRLGGVAVGQIPDITVVDARGTLSGWSVGVGVASPEVAPDRWLVLPTRVQTVHGNPGAATPSGATRIQGEGIAELATAAPGDGGGTFVVSGRVVLFGSPPDTFVLAVESWGG